MAQLELITHEKDNDEAWVCICGNEPSKDGFYPCDEQGNEMAPVAGWSNSYVCFHCGRIIDPDSLRVLGRNPKPKLLA